MNTLGLTVILQSKHELNLSRIMEAATDFTQTDSCKNDKLHGQRSS